MATMASSSGYPDYGALIEPILSDQLLERFLCHSPFMDVATGRFLDPLRRCGDTIRFRRPATATVRPLEKNQKLDHDFLDTDTVVIRSSKGLYFSLKMDDIDAHMICNSNQLVQQYLMSAQHQLSLGVDLDVLATMVLNVDSANQGNCAGYKSRCYQLGQQDDPLCINEDNILEWFCSVYTVLYESCIVNPGYNMEMTGPLNGTDLFAMVPIEALNLLKIRLSKTHGCNDAATTPLVTGRLPQAIQGFDMYLSQSLPYTVNDQGEKIYMLPAGRKDATGFTTTITQSRIVTLGDCFAQCYQGALVWASGVLYPEALALSHVKFEKTRL